MPDPGLVLAEPLCQEVVSSSARCNGKVLRFLSLLSGLGFVMLLSSGNVQHLTIQKPVLDMITSLPLQRQSSSSISPWSKILPSSWPSSRQPLRPPFLQGSQARDVTACSFSALLGRRSVVKYDLSKQVPAEMTTRALEAAILAPNHFLSEPWRFYALGPETKAKLAGLNEDKRKMAEAVPEMMVVTVASEHELSEKLGLEDHAAVACAVQNFMLSLASEGVGSKWMTGALGVAPEDVLATVGAGSGEKLMGVIWYGYPDKPLEDAKTPPRKKGVEGVLSSPP